MAVEPWNFPYYQLARIAGPQVVAGNVLIVKHARNVPQCAIAFQKVIEEVGASPRVYTNLSAASLRSTRSSTIFVFAVSLSNWQREGWIWSCEASWKAIKKGCSRAWWK